MEGYETEKEQIEALKKWWKNNGSSTITGVLLGLSVIFAGKAWFGYQARQEQNASNLYSQFMAGLEQNDTVTMSKLADTLIGDHNSSPYAGFAALAMAKTQIEQGELAAATAQLQWVVQHAKAESMRHSARLRLVRVYLAENNLDAAGQLLQAAGAVGEYVGLYDELQGDLALARGDRKAAQNHYTRALADLKQDAPSRSMVQLKLDDVAMVEAQP